MRSRGGAVNLVAFLRDCYYGLCYLQVATSGIVSWSRELITSSSHLRWNGGFPGCAQRFSCVMVAAQRMWNSQVTGSSSRPSVGSRI